MPGNAAAVILAAGEGTRLKSRLPKVLHEVAGRPLLAHVLAALTPLTLDRTIVVASTRRDEIESVMSSRGFKGLSYVVQDPPRGTADAVRVALDAVPEGISKVLVLSGDAPLIEPEMLTDLLSAQEEGGPAAILTSRVADPSGYGRVVRGADGSVDRIIEHEEASGDEREIDEINAGFYVFEASILRELIGSVGSDNARGEHYLPDMIGLLRDRGEVVVAVEADPDQVRGVNDRVQLAEAGVLLRRRTCTRWMEEGVTVIDPSTVYIDPTVTIEPEAVIQPFTFLEGDTVIEAGAVVGPQSRVVDSRIGEGAAVSFSVVVSSEIGPSASVGPFASLRPGTIMKERSKIGTFVEAKNTTLGEESKANHLTYLGDATVGRRVNVGAGTITCNWDGSDKHETVIDDDVYVSSDTMLVAPVHLGKRSATGAGSVVRNDVPADALAVGVPAKIIEGKGDRMQRRRDGKDRGRQDG